MGKGKSRDGLLLALHKAQADSGGNYLSNEKLKDIAIDYHVSLAEVTGTASFYSMFSTKPRGKYVVRVCESLPCRICGSVDIYLALEEILGIRNHETTADALFTLELVNCVGCCDRSPVVMINDDIHTGMTPDRIRELIGEIRRKEGADD